MKLKTLLLTALAGCASLLLHAEPEIDQSTLGKEKTVRDLYKVRIQNYQGEPLGRIKGVGIDLINGRIIEVFVVSGDFMGIGGKVVSVPPLALIADPAGAIYYLDASTGAFKAAPAVDLSVLPDAHRTDLVAEAYERFGQEPYFLKTGEPFDKSAARPKVPLGIVQRANKIMRMPVENLQHETLGTVGSMSLDISKGRILNVGVVSPGFIKTQSLVPPTALSFNPAHDTLVLDQSQTEFDAQPQQVTTVAANGQEATTQEEPYKGPRTNVRLEQGRSYRDIDRTALITRNLRAAKITGLSVIVGTVDGRVTLRGSARSEADKLRAGAIAIAASRVEVVDNQLNVVPRT